MAYAKYEADRYDVHSLRAALGRAGYGEQERELPRKPGSAHREARAGLAGFADRLARAIRRARHRAFYKTAERRRSS